MIQINDILDAYWRRIAPKARQLECRPELADAFDSLLRDGLGGFGAELANQILGIQSGLTRIEKTVTSIEARQIAMEEAQIKNAIETWKSIHASGLSKRQTERISSEVILLVDRLKTFKNYYLKTRQSHLRQEDCDDKCTVSDDIILAAIDLMIGTAYVRWLRVPQMGRSHLKSASAAFRSAAYRLSEDSMKALLLAGRCEQLQHSFPKHDDLIGHPSYNEANAILAMHPPFGIAASEPRTTSCDVTGAASEDEHLDRQRRLPQMLSSHSAQLSRYAQQQMVDVQPRYESLLWLSDCAEGMLDV